MESRWSVEAVSTWVIYSYLRSLPLSVAVRSQVGAEVYGKAHWGAAWTGGGMAVEAGSMG